MRVAISHRDLSSNDLQLLLGWYRVRDTLLGENCVNQNVKKALELAVTCNHPNAVWLTNLFAGRDVKTPQEARQVFLHCEEDPRALCFAGLLVSTFHDLRRSAELGDAYAQARMAERTIDADCFRWAEKAAAQGERDGFFHLGDCWKKGKGCEKDEKKAKESLLVASELEHIYGMYSYGKLLDKTDTQRIVWMGKAAVYGSPLGYWFLLEVEEQMQNCNSGRENGSVVFAIGRTVKAHIIVERKELFGYNLGFDFSNQAVKFYHFQLQSYRNAVNTWTLVGIRLNLM
jgi:hypothetical protein